MIFLTKESDFQLKEVKQSLYFYAPWMPFHKKMMVMLGKMEEKYKNIEFLAIDTDAFKTFCKRFDITSIPTILLMDNGKEKKRITGLVLTSALKSAFADICNSEPIGRIQ